MQAFPHQYSVSAVAEPEGDVDLNSERLPMLHSAPPPEFGGPDDRWSPETLLVAAVADCFILTFRAIARASNFAYVSLECRAEGTLDRVDRVTQFTDFRIQAVLRVSEGTDDARARSLMLRAEQLCLITNSLKAICHLDAEVEVVSLDETAAE